MTNSKTVPYIAIALVTVTVLAGITMSELFQPPIEDVIPSFEEILAIQGPTSMFMLVQGVGGVPGEDIEGESTDGAHENWIDVLSISHKISNPTAGSVSSGSAGARTTGPVDHSDFTVTKTLDKASPKFSTSCCNGDHIDEITVELCRATGDKQCYMKYIFSDVIITSITTSGSTGDERPGEEVGFNYATIEWQYTIVDPKTGKATGSVTKGWNLVGDAEIP